MSSITQHFNDVTFYHHFDNSEQSINDYFHIESFEQFIVKTIYFSIFQVLLYLAVSVCLEYMNPMPKNSLRLSNIQREIKMGLKQIIAQCLFSTSFYYFIYPHTRYYKAEQEANFGIISFFIGMFFQMAFQTCIHRLNLVFQYWVHRLNHLPFFYQKIHRYHHSFREPTAFCSVAAHPLEGIMEVNLLLHIPELIIPIHPLSTLLCVVYIAIFEMIGHDGGEFDDSDDYKHHLYYTVNFTRPIMDNTFGTAYDPKNFPIKAKCTYVDNVYNYSGAIFNRYK